MDDKCDSEDILYSKDLVQDRLFSCHTVNDDLIVAFHQDTARLYDGILNCKQYAKWDDLLPVEVINLMDFGVATNHADCEETGWIIVCKISKNSEQVPCKSVYD